MLFATEGLSWLLRQESGDNLLIHLSSISRFIKVLRGKHCQRALNLYI